jgi:tetratricopeptide (TPR) repeat protein
LEARGLVQLDRRDGTVDLHPVVRGYAVGCLDAEARGTAGQRVADYFASQTTPDYSRVATLSELANELQAVQALNLAGKLDAAWSALSSLARVLRRLERAELLLALLRPWFPDGWRARPVPNREVITIAAKHALWESGKSADVKAQIILDIEELCTQTLSPDLSTAILNHALILKKDNALAQCQRIFELARNVCMALNDNHRLLHCDLFGIDLMVERGAYCSARELWNASEHNFESNRYCEVLDHGIIETEGRLLHLGGTLTAAWLQETSDRARVRGWRGVERSLLRLQGEWLQDQHKHTEAVRSFDRALAMAREVGLSDRNSEVKRGLSLLRLGNLATAEAAAASAERQPPHAALATLYLALGQHDKARRHALDGYKWAWADGPPYSLHLELLECRSVLQALNEPEPVLPPYDNAKIPTPTYEDIVCRKIAQHVASKKN